MKNYNPDTILSPEDVLKSISADFKIKGLTHKEAAQKLGYGSKQTLGNLLASKKYLTGHQAKKFNSAFGYCTEFLMCGKGKLTPEENERSEREIFEERLDQEMAQNKLWLISTWLHEFFTKEKNEKGLTLLAEINRVIQYDDLVAIENINKMLGRTNDKTTSESSQHGNTA